MVVWFRHLVADWFIRQQPHLQDVPFVFVKADHGRMVISAASVPALQHDIRVNMVLADARAICPALEVFDEIPSVAEIVLRKLCEWCIQFTPIAAIDLPGGLVLDITGCAHLWGGEEQYFRKIRQRLSQLGYQVRCAIADTIGAAWALSRGGLQDTIIPDGKHREAMLSLSPASLRLDLLLLEKMDKLGLYTIQSFIDFPSSILNRRFGELLSYRLAQALGNEEEWIDPIFPVAPYHEYLPSFEPIATKTGIEIALEKLLKEICYRLQKEGKGLRAASLKIFKTDGSKGEIKIATNRPSNNAVHLFKLFELKIEQLDPAPGIEVFLMDVTSVEDTEALQESLFGDLQSLKDSHLAELLDRISGRFGSNKILRFLPAPHHWPERSFATANSLSATTEVSWHFQMRPLRILKTPERIQVTAPIPDYPPMVFRYKEKLHRVRKADGPERIEIEWWLDGGLPRDYYCIEDEEGKRYWLFRTGLYDSEVLPVWFIHGFFA